MASYASLSELRQTLAFGTADTSHDTLLTQMLIDVSADIDAMCGRSFTNAGTVTAYFDVRDGSTNSLALATNGRRAADGRALDLQSVSNLYVRMSEASSYVELSQVAEVDYFLQAGAFPGTAGAGWPYEDIALNPSGAYPYWPTGFRAVKVTGVWGFAAVPAVVNRACSSEVRERFRQTISGGAAPQGVNEFGTPVFLTGDSPDMQRLKRPPYAKRSYASL